MVMKRILLPTDFSENSRNAIHYAMQLYEHDKCEFYLLHVLKASTFISDDLMGIHPSETLYNSLISASKKRLETLIVDLKNQYQNRLHEFHSNVDYDNFIDAINQIVTSKNIDLILMGTKGASNVESIVFGSNTVRVIQRSTCPVMSIPNGYVYKPLQNIAFTSNFLSKYHGNDIQPLVELATHNKCKIDVLHLQEDDHISEVQERNRSYLDFHFSNIDYSFVVMAQNDLFKTITNYIDQNNIGLLAMMRKKHSFLERLFTIHTVEKFAFKIHVPFLVMEHTGEL